MNPRPATWVTTDLHLRLVVPHDAAVAVQAKLRYDCGDPYAVTVAFHAGGADSVEWTFARQLLSDGITAPAGEGDVRVWPVAPHRPHPAGVRLLLSSPSGAALFEAPSGELLDFLTRTYAIVPLGVESDYLDLDAELAILLWSGVDD